MPSSAQRRKAAPDYAWRRRRLAAIVAGLMVLGGMVAVTSFASAADERAKAACEDAVEAQRAELLAEKRRQWQQEQPPPEQPPAEEPPADQPPAEQPPAEQPAPPEEQPGEQPPAEQPPAENPTDEVTPPQEEQPPPPEECNDVPEEDKPAPPPNNGLDVIARDCQNSRLSPHTGFQEGERCVSTALGEVGAENRNPTLLITSAPRSVRRNQAFQIKFSTRNLVRDRFLAAGVGGYYLESSTLTEDGLARGHAHVSCRKLNSTRNAPRPEPVPAFFKAVEDRQGGGRPDTVSVEIPGLAERGIHQCSVWAGANFHGIPMMARANQHPAFDSVRVFVR